MNKRALAYFALFYLCIVWGTTYLVMRIGIQHFPAWLFSGLRNTMAGSLLLLGLSLLKIKQTWRWKTVYPHLVAGVLVIACGNGLVGWAVRYIPSGLAALLCTLVPLYITLLSVIFQKEQKLNSLIVLGILLGLLGMGFVFHDNVSDLANHDYLVGVLIVMFASMCWSAGTVYTKIKAQGTHPFYSAALQLLSGGLVLMVASAFTEDWSVLSAMSTTTGLSLAYLTFFGSMVAFVAYQFSLANLPVGLMSIYAYINPLVAVVLGYYILQERLTIYTGIAAIFTLTGVYLVNKGYNLQKKKTTH